MTTTDPRVGRGATRFAARPGTTTTNTPNGSSTMHDQTRRYVATLARRQHQHHAVLLAAGVNADITGVARAAAYILDQIGTVADPAAFVAQHRDAFRAYVDDAVDEGAAMYAATVADTFGALVPRMGNIGEPLHEDEGADDEPLTVPEVWPTPVPEHEPVPA